MSCTLEKSELDYAVVYIVTILAVVEDTYAVVALGKVGKLVCTYLKLCGIPACVCVSRTLNTTELNFVCSLICVDINGECCLDKYMLLIPLCCSVKVNLVDIGIEPYLLLNYGVVELPVGSPP